MGVAINVEQGCCINLRVDLGRRQAGVAEQFLQTPQISARTEQMCGEGMAQRVGSGCGWQAKERAGAGDGARVPTAGGVAMKRSADRSATKLPLPVRDTRQPSAASWS